MKRLVLLALCLSSTALALFTPAQLAQMTKSPDRFRPTEKFTDSRVNSGFPVYSWHWGSGIVPDLQLQRSPRNAQAWELTLGDDAYTLAKVAPQRKLLAVIDDPLENVKLSIYAITGGAFKGAYALDSRYRDGRGGVTIQTKAFALAAAAGSEFRSDTNTKLLSYPLYGVLSAKGAMCQQPEVTCK